jgi:peroxiredoxin
MMGILQRHRGERILHYAILVASVVLNVALIVRVGQLEFNLRAAAALRVIANRNAIATGDVIPELQATGADGRRTTIALAGQQQPTVIYVFSPTCHWCTRNWQNVNMLAGRLRESHRMVGVSLSARELAGYIRKVKVGFPVYSADIDKPVGSGKKEFSGATPQTVLVDTNGKIQRIWSGAYFDATGREMEAFFGVSFPGLTPEGAEMKPSIRREQLFGFLILGK